MKIREQLYNTIHEANLDVSAKRSYYADKITAAEKCEAIVEDVAIRYNSWAMDFRLFNRNKWRDMTDKELFAHYKLENNL